jgi:multidrug resistance efflux pump
MKTPREPLDDRPRLRADLEVFAWRAPYGDLSTHFLRDPRTGEVFDLGEEGLFLCQLLDGTMEPEEIRGLYEERFKTPLEPEAFDVFVRQLAQGGLLEEPQSAARKRIFTEIFDPEEFIPLLRFNLARGDHALGRLARRLGWLGRWPVLTLSAALILWSCGVIATSWRAFFQAIGVNWNFGFFLILIACASLLVQSPRALAHGIICKRYGGQVSKIGIAVIYYLLPSLFCDWSGVIWLRDRTKRIRVIFGGIYFQIIIWAAATIGWHLTRPGSLPNTVLLALSLAAGLGLLIFNGNPLVKMDGYLMLVNWLEIPHLRERSLAVFGAWMTGRPAPEALTRRQSRWFTLFGGLCFGYGVLMLGVHLWWAWIFLTPIYEGAGALATILIGLYFLQRPLIKFFGRRKSVRWLLAKEAPARRWAFLLIVIPLGVSVSLLPYPYEPGGPLRLLPSQRVAIRSEIEGLVEEVLVREGQWVGAGQPVALVSRRIHERNFKATMAQLEETRAELELLWAGAKPEEIARAESAVRTAETSLAWSEPQAVRYAELFAQHVVSQQQYDNATRQWKVDAAQLQEARANLDLVTSGSRSERIRAMEAKMRSLQALVDHYKVDLERTTLTSSTAGRVVTPRVEETAGLYLEPGRRDLVMEIENDRVLRAEIEVPEQDIADVRIEAAVKIVVWAHHDVTFHGEVVNIAPAAATMLAPARLARVEDERSDAARVAVLERLDKAIRVITEIPNPDGLLKSEMTGYAKIEIGRRPVWDVLFRPIIRWFMVQVWYWIP